MDKRDVHDAKVMLSNRKVVGAVVTAPPRSATRRDRFKVYNYKVDFGIYHALPRLRDGRFIWRKIKHVDTVWSKTATSNDILKMAQSISVKTGLPFNPNAAHNKEVSQ